MKLLIVSGTRPNHIKLAPLVRELQKRNFTDYKIINTCQHYDDNLSGIFFEQFDIANLIHLKLNTSEFNPIQEKFSEVCEQEKPDLTIVIGDVNSTAACARAASLYGSKIAHIESGERCFDDSVPEENNRIIADHLSDFLFCSTFDAKNHLIMEGIPKEKIHLVGNIAVDNLIWTLGKLKNTQRFDKGKFIFCTIHRQENADNKDNLESILKVLNVLSKKIKIVFPIHPRTKKRISEFGLEKYLELLSVCEPLGYLDCVLLMRDSLFVVTDSGGIQTETTVLGTPCLTVRKVTEHKCTIRNGTNILVGANEINIMHEALKIMAGTKKVRVPDVFWDGKVSERIINVLMGI